MVNMSGLFLYRTKKSIAITTAFKNFLDEFNSEGCKPNKIWIVKCSKFYHRSMSSWLQDNNVEMNSTHNEGKSDVADRFIRTLMKKVYK